ncbi:MAG TPA: DUF3551 domain-containing protein [Xanthobacteraceae bacterium]|jgi:hypothetical protein|nr:DUF3551 domain-containing protein [Xanthobacteraceae bacterium]
MMLAVRLSLTAGALLMAGLLTTPDARAQNYPWCAEYSEDMGGSRNCGFVSFSQCMATIQGMGGFCDENNTYAPPPGPHNGPASAPRTYKRHKKTS